MSDFQAFVSDQLSELGPEVRFKRMFGGWGIYYDADFFGLIADGRLYFKTDETSRKAYIKEDMGPFTFEMRPKKDSAKKKSVMKNYYEVPVRVLEDSDDLCLWAEQAIDVAKRG